MEDSVEISKKQTNKKKKKNKLGIKPPYDPAITLLGTYPEETKIEKIHVSHCSLQQCLQ